MALEDYKDIVGTTASFSTILHFLSGALICHDIIKKGDSTTLAPAPFVLGTVMGTLMFRYGFMLGDPAMIQTNIVGLSLSIVYLAIYYYYSKSKRSLNQMLLKSGGFAAAALVVVSFLPPPTALFVMGMIVTAAMMTMMAAPLFSLGEIMRTKSTESLPLPMIITGTLITFQWLLYGIIIKDAFVQIQNTIGLVLSAIQLSLFAIYPRKPAKDKKTE